MTDKEKLIKIFRENVKGMCPDVSGSHVNHDGKEGHWLERRFGINHNASNTPDLFGYELKNSTSQKITFGDWSANRYIFNNPNYSHIFTGRTKAKRQNQFLRIFGRPNPKKNDRHSWSGEPCPKIVGFNRYGQKLIVLDNLDIVALYDYNYDTRQNKQEIIPIEFQNGLLEVARWFGKTSPTPRRTDKCLKDKLEDKFNQKGWFTCKRDSNGGEYTEICFGEPIDFSTWIEWVKEGKVFLDSGMYEGNSRPYSQWRMNNVSWDELITECYE